MVLQAGDRRQLLRRATAAAHRKLDALIDGAGLLNSRARYEDYLRATWAARWPDEQALELSNVGELYTAWPHRRLCAFLSEDLFDVSHARPVDPAWVLPGRLCKARSLGVLYVLEGSALGARVLAPRAAAIGMTACFGARHLAHQTSQPSAWAAFIDLLTRTPMTGPDEELCVAAALATFERYEQAFAHLANAR